MQPRIASFDPFGTLGARRRAAIVVAALVGVVLLVLGLPAPDHVAGPMIGVGLAALLGARLTAMAPPRIARPGEGARTHGSPGVGAAVNAA